MQYTTKQHEQANSIISSWVKAQSLKMQRSVIPEQFKQIVNGKTYNNSTAEWLTSFHFYNDHAQYLTVDETLYITRKGEYFLCGEGMQLTPYSAKLEDCDDRVRGHGILPLTSKQVKEWFKIRCLEDEMEDTLAHSV